MITQHKFNIDEYGDKYWWQRGKLHRTDGPAIEYADGDKEWYQNGLLHREDGPACEWNDGEKWWYMDGIRYSFAEWLAKCPLSLEEKAELVLNYG